MGYDRNRNEKEGRLAFLREHLGGMLLLLLIISMILLGGFFLLCFRIADTGNSVVLVDPLAKRISQGPIGPAWFLKAPWVDDVHIYFAMDSVAMWTEWTMEGSQWRESGRGDYPAITCLSKDGLQIEVDLLVRWSLNPDKLVELYQRFPDLKWKERAITSIIREVARNVISKYSAIDVIEKRDLITHDLKEVLRESLLSEPTLEGVIASETLDVDLRDIDPPFEFLTAIQNKLKAQQDMISAEYKKQETIVLAQAEASKLIIEAEGFAEATIIRAESVKEAVKLICEAGNVTDTTKIAELYLTLEALKQIKGTLIVVFSPEEGVPFVFPVPQE